MLRARGSVGLRVGRQRATRARPRTRSVGRALGECNQPTRGRMRNVLLLMVVHDFISGTYEHGSLGGAPDRAHARPLAREDGRAGSSGWSVGPDRHVPVADSHLGTCQRLGRSVGTFRAVGIGRRAPSASGCQAKGSSSPSSSLGSSSSQASSSSSLGASHWPMSGSPPG